MNFAIGFATQNESKALGLGVWEENEKAISFYKRFGFKDTGAAASFFIGATKQTDYWFIKRL